MTPSHIEHIGIAVTNLDEAIRYWEDVMGLKCYAIEEVKDQKVKTAFFKIGEVKIELLEPREPRRRRRSAYRIPAPEEHAWCTDGNVLQIVRARTGQTELIFMRQDQ